jgi:MFS transporter, YNFM family, putative membrane transport protein
LLGWTGTTVVFSVATLVATLAVWVCLPAGRGFTRTEFDLGDALTQTKRALRDRAIVSWCVIGGCSMGAFVGVYNAMAFRIHTVDIAVGSSLLVYLAFPVGVIAPGLARPIAVGMGRPATVLVALGLLAVGILITLGSGWPTVIGGLGVLTFAFFVVHSLASGGIVARAHAIGIGAGRASSNYLVSYYVGGAVLGALTSHIWSVQGWSAVVVTLLGVIAVAGAAAGRIVSIPRQCTPNGESL